MLFSLFNCASIDTIMPHSASNQTSGPHPLSQEHTGSLITHRPAYHTQARIRSVRSTEDCIIQFVNESDAAVRAIWLDFNGNEVRVSTLLFCPHTCPF